MIQLRALNDTDTSEENSILNDCDNYKISGEAEETIVISEYIRALKLKDAKKYKAALSLLLELLGTNVLNKAPNDSKNDQILLVKYNCLKNVGFIFKECGQNEMALYYLIKATQMDGSDIHTLFLLGQLAHSAGNEQMATICYEKCIEYNMNHWPSKEGLLKIMCTTNNVIDAYFWARNCLEQDASYVKAMGVLLKISCQFSTCLKFLENIFGAVLECNHNVSNGQNLISGIDLPMACKGTASSNDFVEIKASNLDWITLGNLIISLQGNMLVSYKVEKNKDSYISTTATECGTTDDASAQNEIQSAFSLENETSGSQEDSDAKFKRRDTELKILEQWGWHKSKRPLRKKNSHDPSDPHDYTADGFIRRTLNHHFLVCYESDTSPFSGKKYGSENEKSHTKGMVSVTDFLDISKIKLNSLIDGLKELNDSYNMAVRYTYQLSTFWNEALPKEICSMYRHLYQTFYLNENDHSWFDLPSADIVIQIQITMFYLELEYDFLSVSGTLRSVSGEVCRKILCSLHLHMSLIEEKLDNYVTLQARYLWLNYIFAKNEGDLHTAITKLKQLLLFISDQNDFFFVLLPNVSFTNYFDLSSVKVYIASLELKINMQNIKSLYETGKYEEVIHILKKCLNESCGSHLYYEHPLNKHAQMEVLLESLWRLGNFQDCISWAEKVLKYSTDNYFIISRNGSYSIEFARSINSALLYIHELIEKLGYIILEFEYISRMVQSIHKILTNLLDSQHDKNVSNNHIIDCWRAWIILHYVLEWENDRNVINRKNFTNQESNFLLESEEEKWFSSYMMFFVAHELLGRRQWCSKGNHKFLSMILNVTVPKLRSPLFEPYRDIIQECLEQTTFCLYGYPQKKARMRHIQDHETTPIDLSWPKAAQLLKIFRPHVLPQFNSYKIDSISTDMETLLQQCISTMPIKYNIIGHTKPIEDFINRKTNSLPMLFNSDVLCFKMNWIYYLLADYYFKCRDFSKAIQYYEMDLTVDPTRFDSWAGISLSKASKCETMIGSIEVLRPAEFLKITDDTLKCFEMCLKINENDPQLWVENGSFAYNVQSYCSRYLKSQSVSPKELSYAKLQQNKYSKIVHKCFNRAINQTLSHEKCSDADNEDHDDEHWLYHYMLGKIFEKDRGDPVVYLTHYFKSSICLYESNATYPIKISHSNPSLLCIESLELFYRTNAAIIKFVERNSNIRHSTGLMFMKILKELAVCPFAVNRAKINEVLLKKHKFSGEQSIQTSERYVQEKDDTMKITSQDFLQAFTTANSINTCSSTSNTSTSTSSDTDTVQEMSSDSDSDCTNMDEDYVDSELRDAIFNECLKNLEECATRFPEHYKSLYRLAYHYMYSPGITKSFDKCYELLLGSYKTALGALVQGIFTERRSNNFFNGIWRIPSSDIDRPGSFETHLCKCVKLLITVLTAKHDHENILELAVHLYRTPETDK